MTLHIMRGLHSPMPWTEKLVARLRNRDYRHAYMVEGVKTWIARQVRALREQRQWSQGDLGRETGKPQSAISRIEDPDYGKLSLQSLFDLAKAYDVAVLVKFVDYQTFLRETKDVSQKTLSVTSFSEQSFAGPSTVSSNSSSFAGEPILVSQATAGSGLSFTALPIGQPTALVNAYVH